MFLFSRKKDMEPEIIDVNQLEDKQVKIEPTNLVTLTKTVENTAKDDMAEDLAYAVEDALTAWAKKYGLENLPRDLILDHAITILQTVRAAARNR